MFFVIFINIFNSKLLVPSWSNPIEELVAKELSRPVLIEILTLLPEELDQSRRQTLRGVGANRRQQFTLYLASIAKDIVNLLLATLQESHRVLASNTPPQFEKHISKEFRCLNAWLTIIDAHDINVIEPLLNGVFEAIQNPDCSDVVHDAACDTICGAALLCEDYQKYQQLTHYLLNQIYKLDAVYHHSVANEVRIKRKIYFIYFYLFN